MSAANAMTPSQAVYRKLARLSARQDYFELLRRIDAVSPQLPPLGMRADVDSRRVRISQCADFGFATREVSTLRQIKQADRAEPLLELGVRHFGMFAPYGPLPITTTETAHAQTAARSRAFEDFVNLNVSRLAILLYRAWAQLKPAVAHDRPMDDRFSGRLADVCGASGLRDDFVARVRSAFPGPYMRRSRALPALEAILCQVFATPMRVVPRASGWIGPLPEPGKQPRRLGRCRLGRRFFDAQYRILVRIGPVGAQDYLKWQRGEALLGMLDAVVGDFIGHRVVVAVDLQISVTSALGMRAKGARLGRSSWLRPSTSIHTQSLRRTQGGVIAC